MKKQARAILRLCALTFVTTAVYTLWLAGLPFVFAFSGVALRWRARLFRSWARMVARIAGMKINLRGEPPRGAFLLVSNHLGYMDVVALAARLDCVFVAKSEVARWPVIGLLARSIGTVFVDRRRHRRLSATLATIERARAGGMGVVIFAEGTSTRGHEVAPFRPSLLELAARTGTPVHYASLSYRTPPRERSAHLAVCWWGDMTFLKHVYEMFQLPSFEAGIVFGEETIQAGNRKILAARLWSAVSAEFVPVV